MLEVAGLNLTTIVPELFIAVSALSLLVVGVYNGNTFALKQIGLSKLVGIIAILLLATIPSKVIVSFSGMFVTSGFTTFCKALVLLGAVISLYLSMGYYRDNKQNRMFEFAILVLLSVVGMSLMISANDLISLYMALELQSLPLYILAAIHKDSKKGSEAGLKYFVLGALSSGIILYGCSLIYGFSGTTNFDSLQNLYLTGGALPVGTLVGIVFLLTGICFKISAVPFHMWTPDVYEGSPMPVTAFFAIAPKIAAVALLIRIVLEPFAGVSDQWQQIIVFVSAASMVVGALGALRQTNIKRLIAYSSIGHVGYILVGLAAATEEGVKGILLYLLIYMTLSAGIFACIMMIKRKEGKSQEISALSGLSKSRPGLALAIAIIMLSMAGIPPFAGFFGKFFVFLAAVNSGLYSLAVIGVLSSVIAAFYYLRIIKIMYFDEAVVPLDKHAQAEMQYIALGSAVFNLGFFVAFTPFVDTAGKAASWLF